MKIKIRPAVLLGEIVLATVACMAMVYNFEQVAIAATVGIASLLPKLVESEEKTDGDGTGGGSAP